MERSEKVDLYRTGLKRQDAYITFMAAGETDLSLLPEPITRTEKLLMELCKEKVDAIKTAKFRPADSEHTEGLPYTGEPNMPAPPEESAPVKKAATRRTTKKAAKG